MLEEPGCIVEYIGSPVSEGIREGNTPMTWSPVVGELNRNHRRIMERAIIYFDRGGPDNTEQTLRAGLARARELGLRYVVVASLSGETACRAAGVFSELPVVIVAVTEREGRRMSQADRERLEALGVQVLTGIHAFHSVESAVYDVLGGAAHEKVIAETLRWFSQGTKVAVECVLMAVDGGLVPAGEEVLSFGGTGKGTDTALIMRSAGVWDLFSRDKAKRLQIREILAMPRAK
jgi:hypothetical protein